MAALRTGSKCIAHPAKGRDSAFSPFRAPDSRDFAKLNLLFLNPNLIFEIGYSFTVPFQLQIVFQPFPRTVNHHIKIANTNIHEFTYFLATQLYDFAKDKYLRQATR